ncbi:hypothetical protein E3N88_15334 [Mikania micrantha]|uniref:Uncharacterized protein n=1 Tax=Mikania micrantha TaxID=192012 RepID=A0A5N6NVC3_9ASTR|nr:hypothetical protein E3N88_15334 [Mikania micrantha]
MSHYQEDDEYLVDEYDIEDMDDDMDYEDHGEDIGSDSDSNRWQDTTAAQARRGKDIQGIPWERLGITREKYRQTRLEQYKNYENIPQSGEDSEKVCKATNKTGTFYEFRRNSRSVRSKILHFQLRNLVWATSKHDVYFMSNFSVFHWSALKYKKTDVLNVQGRVAPCEKHPGSLLEGFTQTQVSTIAVKDNLLVAGGFQGEIICKYLDRPGVCFCSRTTYEQNAITNAIDIYTTPSGAVHFAASNNDCGVRVFDMEKFQMTQHFRFPWPVNHTSISPDGRLLIVVGDNPEGMLVDSRSGKTVASLHGHLDFSFASAWHPNGQTFATGNQDKTCRIWDARNLSESVTALKGNIGAVRSIRYSSDGRFMAMAEPADFVHVFDVKHGYKTEQEIDFFGEISGISFSPDTESLFIGSLNTLALKAAKEAAWLKKFIVDLKVVPSIEKPIEIYCENSGAIAHAMEPWSHHNSKHVLRKFNYIQKTVEWGDVFVSKVHTNLNLVNPFTKPMAYEKHEVHANSIELHLCTKWT